MKKIFLFMVSIFALCACDGEKTYTVGQNAFCVGLDETSEETVFCVDAEQKPINGMVVEYRENGKILREMTIRNGRENGTEREFYENGKLHVVANVVDGKTEGKSSLYNPDGSLYMEIDWTDGVAKTISVYDKSGNIIQTSNDL